jgi:hypothetical protein
LYFGSWVYGSACVVVVVVVVTGERFELGVYFFNGRLEV